MTNLSCVDCLASLKISVKCGNELFMYEKYRKVSTLFSNPGEIEYSSSYN